MMEDKYMDLEDFIYNLIILFVLIIGVIVVIAVALGPFVIIGYFLKEIISIIVGAL